MKKYLQSHIWDFIFTVMIAVGLGLNVLSSFELNTPLLTNYAVMILTVVAVNLFCFISGYNKKNTITGIITGIVLVVAGVVLVASKGYFSSGNETAASVPIFWAVMIFSAVFTYLLTRNRKIAIFFSVGALIVCAAFRFLEYPVSTVGFLVMTFGLVLEILCRVYHDSLEKASYGTYSFKHFAVQSIAVTLVVMLLSSGVYYGVVRPLEPQTRELKLITKLLSFDVLEKVGISSKLQVQNPNIQSDVTNDEQRKTKQENDVPDEPQTEPEEEDKDDDVINKTQNELKAFAISYADMEYVRYVIAGAIVLVILLPFVIKYMLRRKQRKKVEAFSPDEGSKYLYAWFLKKFDKLGIGKAANITVLEYVQNSESGLRDYVTESGTDFKALTDVYNKTIYGTYEPTDDDYALFKDFYNSFFKNVKNSIGVIRYAFKFWVI